VERAIEAADGDAIPVRDWTRPGQRLELRFRFTTARDGTTVQRGQELATYDFNRDGTITLRALSASLAPDVVRDTTYTLAADYTPLECFLRLQVNGVHEGSGWFCFEEDRVYVATRTRTEGLSSRSVPVKARARAFNAHPVVTDALLCAAHESAGAARQVGIEVYTSSEDPYGRTGPTLVPLQLEIEHVGRRRRSTVAGEIECEHYALYPGIGAPEPLQEIWCLPGTCVLIHARAGGAYATDYELVGWKVT
jgi:hypothetical protein